MADRITIFSCNYKIWWAIFFSLQLFLIVIMVATLGTTKWVSSKNNFSWYDYSNNIAFNGYSFEGSLTKCTEGCSDSDSYAKIATDWCDAYNDYKDNYNDDSYTLDNYKTMCSMFGALYGGAWVFTILEVSAMIAIILWGVGMFCYTRKINCLPLSYCCTCCLWTSHYLAVFFYIGISNLTFNSDECDSYPEDGNRPKLCSGDGPNLALFTLLVIPFIVILFCIVACNLHRHHGHHFKKGAPTPTANIQVVAIPPAYGLNGQPPVYYPGNQPYPTNPAYPNAAGPTQHYPGNNPPVYNPMMPPYNPMNASYNPGNPPYNPGNQPYNPGNPPHIPGNQPYNPGNPPYNPGNQPYNPGNPPYNPGNPPYNPGNQPYYSENQPYNPSGNPSKVDESQKG